MSCEWSGLLTCNVGAAVGAASAVEWGVWEMRSLSPDLTPPAGEASLRVTVPGAVSAQGHCALGSYDRASSEPSRIF